MKTYVTAVWLKPTLLFSNAKMISPFFCAIQLVSPLSCPALLSLPLTFQYRSSFCWIAQLCCRREIRNWAYVYVLQLTGSSSVGVTILKTILKNIWVLQSLESCKGDFLHDAITTFLWNAKFHNQSEMHGTVKWQLVTKNILLTSEIQFRLT